jgi:hypothetical protein
MSRLFDTEQEASDHKTQHQMFQVVPEYLRCYRKWALVFPIKAHVTVIPHTQDDKPSTQRPEGRSH